MRRLVLALLLAVGCQTPAPPVLERPPSLPPLDLQALVDMDADDQKVVLRAWAVEARARGALPRASVAAPAIASPGASQGAWDQTAVLKIGDANVYRGWDSRRLQVVARPQHHAWWVSIRQRPGSAPELEEIRWHWRGECVQVRARFLVPPTDWIDPDPPTLSPWSNTLRYRDCLEPPPALVPEPNGLALLASGIAVLAIIHRRRGTHVR